MFVDMTEIMGFAGIDLPFTGFGCGFLDFDNDADLDIALVNGRVKRDEIFDGADLGQFWNFYAEPNLLFQNNRQPSVSVGNRQQREEASSVSLLTAESRQFPTAYFSDVSARAPDFTGRVEVSRGNGFR